MKEIVSKNFELTQTFCNQIFFISVTTHLTNLYTFIKTENKDTFSIKLLVQYPMQKVYYIPSLWHKIKMAWIQYFAMFVIVSWILNKIKDFMYHRKWLLFYEESPIKKNI